ncbi:hypothetical protein L3Y34_013397 [Caenorhabditis briggsae]|uniref:Phlebovirus glycoprotein G2 fusion domain-containing protein n=1 Tax=Caenorhabditis briggsae TaxID=6238 RepID=A0AAE9A184_CAEBR|nr:hypothetical protein L3Y34_013397 [Caenorhabditis briggsae]
MFYYHKCTAGGSSTGDSCEKINKQSIAEFSEPSMSGPGFTNCYASCGCHVITAYRVHYHASTQDSPNRSIPSTSQDSSVQSGNVQIASNPGTVFNKIIGNERFNTWCLDHGFVMT